LIFGFYIVIVSNTYKTSINFLDFRRSDGGRFSMRSGNNGPVMNGKPGAPKPPFRAGIAPPSKKVSLLKLIDYTKIFHRLRIKLPEKHQKWPIG
jgi:hypothetical protein